MSARQNLKETQKLAEKDLGITVVLTFFLFIAGYIYTGRYKALLVSFLIFVASARISEGLYPFLAIGTTIENARVVSKAKRQMKSLQEDVSSFTVTNKKSSGESLDIVILKVIKAKGAATLADLVIETGKKVVEINPVLLELQRHDLIRVDNRDDDGAIIYKII